MFGWTKNSTAHNMDCGAATTGLLAGTRVATAMGWRAVEALAVGDLVLTFDAGMQPLLDVRRDVFWAADAQVPSAYAPLFVPAGALGNTSDMELLADQGVLVESDAACDAYGDPFAVLSATALEGYRGIRRLGPRQQIEIITLVFAQDQVAYVEGGALVHCPHPHLQLDAEGDDMASYAVVPARDAAFLVDCMMHEDAQTGGIAA